MIVSKSGRASPAARILGRRRNPRLEPVPRRRTPLMIHRPRRRYALSSEQRMAGPVGRRRLDCRPGRLDRAWGRNSWRHGSCGSPHAARQSRIHAYGRGRRAGTSDPRCREARSSCVRRMVEGPRSPLAAAQAGRGGRVSRRLSHRRGEGRHPLPFMGTVSSGSSPDGAGEGRDVLFLGRWREYVGSPMLPPLYPAWAAMAKDRDLASRCSRRAMPPTTCRGFTSVWSIGWIIRTVPFPQVRSSPISAAC